MTKNKKISIDKLDIDLVFEDLIIEEIPKKDYCVISNNNAIVSINTKLDDALINEGIVRDIIRKIQNFRKDSGLKVEDRISISILSDDKVYQAIDSNRNYFLSEVLGVDLVKGINNEKFSQKFIVKDMSIELGISKK